MSKTDDFYAFYLDVWLFKYTFASGFEWYTFKLVCTWID